MSTSEESLRNAQVNAGLAEPGQTSPEAAEAAAGREGEIRDGATVEEVRSFLDDAGDDAAERARRADVAQAFEDAREGDNRAGVTQAIERARADT